MNKKITLGILVLIGFNMFGVIASNEEILDALQTYEWKISDMESK